MMYCISADDGIREQSQSQHYCTDRKWQWRATMVISPRMIQRPRSPHSPEIGVIQKRVFQAHAPLLSPEQNIHSTIKPNHIIVCLAQAFASFSKTKGVVSYASILPGECWIDEAARKIQSATWTQCFYKIPWESYPSNCSRRVDDLERACQLSSRSQTCSSSPSHLIPDNRKQRSWHPRSLLHYRRDGIILLKPTF